MGCAPRKDHVEDEDENSMSASRNCPPQQHDQCANDDSADYHTAGDLSAYCSSDDDDGSDTSRDNQAQDGHTPELSAAILQRVDTAKQMFRRQFTQLGDANSPAGIEWAVVKDRKDPPLQVCSAEIPQPGGGMLRWKAVGELPHSFSKICDAIFESANRLQWDANMQSIECLHQFGDGLKIVRYVTNSVGPIASRDFIDLIAEWSTDQQSQPRTRGQCGFSLDSSDWAELFPDGVPQHLRQYVEECDGCVRGKNYTPCGWLFQDTGTDLVSWYYCIQSDIRGSMPSWIVNSAMANTFKDFSKSLTTHCSAH